MSNAISKREETERPAGTLPEMAALPNATTLVFAYPAGPSRPRWRFRIQSCIQSMYPVGGAGPRARKGKTLEFQGFPGSREPPVKRKT